MKFLLPVLLLSLYGCQMTEEQKAARQVRVAKVGSTVATVGASLFTIALQAAANAAVANLNQQNSR